MGKFPHEIDQMPYSDFIAFMVKSKISPIGNIRLDQHHALLMWQLERVNHGGKTPFNKNPSDFMPYKQEKKQTDAEIEAAINATLSKVKDV